MSIAGQTLCESIEWADSSHIFGGWEIADGFYAVSCGFNALGWDIKPCKSDPWAYLNLLSAQGNVVFTATL